MAGWFHARAAHTDSRTTDCRVETLRSRRCLGAEVDRIRERFESLTPWRDTLKVPFLKLEKENFASDGERHQLYAYCVSAKLYSLFNLDGNRLLVRKPSGHGLGFIQAPYTYCRLAAKDRPEME